MYAPSRKDLSLQEVFIVLAVLAVLAGILWYNGYTGFAELRLRTQEADAAVQELSSRCEGVNRIRMYYRAPFFVRVNCEIDDALTLDNAKSLAEDIAELIADEAFVSSYSDLYSRRYNQTVEHIECAMLYFTQPGESLPKYQLSVTWVNGSYSIAIVNIRIVYSKHQNSRQRGDQGAAPYRWCVGAAALGGPVAAILNTAIEMDQNAALTMICTRYGIAPDLPGPGAAIL